jgi:hypothetical protein
MEIRAGRSGHLSDFSTFGPGPPVRQATGVMLFLVWDIFLPEQEAFEWVKGSVAKPEHGRGGGSV